MIHQRAMQGFANMVLKEKKKIKEKLKVIV